jgi:hypothetical protein
VPIADSIYPKTLNSHGYGIMGSGEFQEILGTAEREIELGWEIQRSISGDNLIAIRELAPGWTLQSVITQSGSR